VHGLRSTGIIQQHRNALRLIVQGIFSDGYLRPEADLREWQAFVRSQSLMAWMHRNHIGKHPPRGGTIRRLVNGLGAPPYCVVRLLGANKSHNCAYTLSARQRHWIQEMDGVVDIQAVRILVATFALFHEMDIATLSDATRCAQWWWYELPAQFRKSAYHTRFRETVQSTFGVQAEDGGFWLCIPPPPPAPHSNTAHMGPKQSRSFLTFGFDDGPQLALRSTYHECLETRCLSDMHRQQMWQAFTDFLQFVRSDVVGNRHSAACCLAMVQQQTITTYLVAMLHKTIGTQRMSHHQGLTTTTVRHMVALNHAIGAGIFPNVSEQICRKRIAQQAFNRAEMAATLDVRTERKTYTAADIARLLAVANSARDKLLLLILGRVGLRNTALRTLMTSNLKEREGVALEKASGVHRFYIDPEI
jgi:hypothetical protein